VAIARTVSNEEAWERILDAARTNIKARACLAMHKYAMNWNQYFQRTFV